MHPPDPGNRRGRPPKYGRAMSDAERAREYRLRRRQRAASGSQVLQVQTDTILLDKIRAAVTAGDRALVATLAAELVRRYPPHEGKRAGRAARAGLEREG